MGNSYTNKNYNRSDYDDLLYFNGFYDNLYREPFTNGFAFVFVTKPLLFINPTKPTATKSYMKHLSYINMTRDQFFLQFLDSEKLNNNDAELVRMLSYDTSFRTTLNDQMRRSDVESIASFSYLKVADPPCYRSHHLGERAIWCVMEFSTGRSDLPLCA